MALLSLLGEWSQSREISLAAVSIDHGLRPEAKKECEMAASLALRLGIEHRRLSWHPPKGGNLQGAARKGRYNLIADWAKANKIRVVALGHTMDDQAETVMMNLARGSGVDGLCAMPAEIKRQGIFWLRPLLDIGRSQLRDYLRDKRIEWAEDPSNDDERFQRVKARRLLEAASELGLTANRLAATARRMQEAKKILDKATDEAANLCASRNELGGITFNWRFRVLPEDVRMRVAADALRAVSDSEYRPRLKSLTAALERSRKCTVTLNGCILKPVAENGLAVLREFAACGPAVPASEVWDGRWRLNGSTPPFGTVIAGTGRKRGRGVEIAAAPALWRSGKLWAAPYLGLRPEWTFEFCGNNPHWQRFSA